MTQKSNDAERRFGRILHRQRRLAGMTQDRLGRELGVSSSYLSNIEHGRRPPTDPLLAAADRILATDGKLTRLWEQLSDTGRPAWLGVLADLEREASMILDCQTHVIPALLQIESYARKIARDLSPWTTEEEIEDSVATKMERAHWFAQSSTPVLWVVLEETVVRRKVGSAAVMQEQLSYLANKVQSGRVKLQVIPVDNGSHPALGGSFKVISADANPDVVYAESVHSGQVVDDPAHVANYRLLYGAIQACALSPDESLRLVEQEVEGLSDEQ